ncbi:MAG: ATP phosphoribosyltransferase regulatory subunit [Clostridiaceae bacterium]|nr:ATP phosphoribosyltransferase regulatory subunit [Clostridiaceae bacterium]
MSKRNIYTPEGVQDILVEECYTKRGIEDSIRKVFRGFGYFEIETPSLEFYDTFSADGDLIPQEAMFKFFDQQGRILVLRPDITIPVARIVATKYKNTDYHLKFSYIGNTFRYNELGGGKQKEFTQAGLELIGIKTPEADAEVIIAAISALKAAGLEDFRVDIGQVNFFEGLMEETGLPRQYTDQMRRLIERKDFTGMEEVIDRCNISRELKELILELPQLFGGIDVIADVEKRVSGGNSLSALDYLRQVLCILGDSGLDKYVSIDLGMVQSLNYYTGVIFKGFTHGIGFPVLSGGRYDNLVGKFGENCPATGFSIGINLLMSAIKNQKAMQGTSFAKPAVDSLVCYEPEGRRAAFGICNELRKRGLVAEMYINMAEGSGKAREYAKTREINRFIYVLSSESIELHDMERGEVIKTSIPGLLGEIFRLPG